MKNLPKKWKRHYPLKMTLSVLIIWANVLLNITKKCNKHLPLDDVQSGTWFIYLPFMFNSTLFQILLQVPCSMTIQNAEHLHEGCRQHLRPRTIRTKKRQQKDKDRKGEHGKKLRGHAIDTPKSKINCPDLRNNGVAALRSDVRITSLTLYL